MKSRAGNCVQTMEVTPMDGTYNGHWSGYKVEFWGLDETIVYSAETESGIRGNKIPCRVVVSGNEIVVEVD